MPIVCAAVVGAANNPVFLETYGDPATNGGGGGGDGSADEAGGGALRYHYAVHCSLDTVEERLTTPRRSGGDDAYMGVLYPADDFVVYGYTTPTRVKLILVAADPQPRDDALRAAFAALHSAFVDAACNPFYSPGDRLPGGGAFGGAVRRAIEGL